MEPQVEMKSPKRSLVALIIHHWLTGAEYVMAWCLCVCLCLLLYFNVCVCLPLAAYVCLCMSSPMCLSLFVCHYASVQPQIYISPNLVMQMTLDLDTLDTVIIYRHQSTHTSVCVIVCTIHAITHH